MEKATLETVASARPHAGNTRPHAPDPFQSGCPGSMQGKAHTSTQQAFPKRMNAHMKEWIDSRSGSKVEGKVGSSAKGAGLWETVSDSDPAPKPGRKNCLLLLRHNYFKGLLKGLYFLGNLYVLKVYTAARLIHNVYGLIGKTAVCYVPLAE